jgi:UDPglucose 6-dehydrogenase
VKIGIVGYGVVGTALGKLLERGGHHEIAIYDAYRPAFKSPERRESVNTCDVAFVAVPTPEGPDGACDVSAVESVLSWVKVPVCIKSTVPPGTVARLAAQYNPRLCFSPEYVGETPWHPWKDIENHGFLIVGGEPETCNLAVAAYQAVLGPGPRYFVTDSATAELCKYMENTFLASKVAFVNQFYDLAQAYAVNFSELRELWLADERIGRSHTIVTEERGYRGRCLPKDIAAIIHAAKQFGGAPLLEAIDRYNDEVCRRADEKRRAAADRGSAEKAARQ